MPKLTMVNVLHDFYIHDKLYGSAKPVFENYSRVIQRNLDDNHREPVRYKWWWFKEYLESEMKRNAFIIHP